MKYNFNSLAGQLLVAMPILNDTFFEKSVILICEHDETGAMGLMINRIYDFPAAEIFSKMKIKYTNEELDDMPIAAGGPVDSEKGLVLYSDVTQLGIKYKHCRNINKTISVCYSEDILYDIADDEMPNPYLMSLGCCEWDPGQLEQELANNDWLTTKATLQLIFNTEFVDIWDECMLKLGVNQIHNLSQHGGTA